MSMPLPTALRSLPDAMAPLGDLEPFEAIRLVVFDLDGTLLKAAGETPGERVLRLQSSAKSFGVRITVATGRTLTGANRVLSTLGASRIPAVLYNGSFVIEPGSRAVIAHRSIAPKGVRQLVQLSQHRGIDVFLYTVAEDLFVLPNYDDPSQLEKVYFLGMSQPPQFDFNGMPIIPCTELPDISQVTAALLVPQATTNYGTLVTELNSIEGITATTSGGRYIEIRPVGSSKATGMNDLSKALGYRPDEVLAVGDNDNDAELLSWAGISVAVSGASPHAQAASTYISRFGAERCAIEVLDLIRRAKRLRRGRGGIHEAARFAE